MAPDGFRRILCPVDFSEISALGLRFADAFARCSDARLTVLYADQFLPPPYFTESRLEEMRQHLRDAAIQAEQRLREFADQTLGPAALDVRVIEALPADGVLKVAGEIPADLIAMGTHGRSGFNRLMLGSVTERVLRSSPVPVLTVHPGAGGESQVPVIRRILTPVNDSEVARRSLLHAARLAKCFHAELTVFHVHEEGSASSIRDLCAWVPEEARSLCSVREETGKGEAANEIIRTASESGCDLLVIGARHHRFFDSTIIGTTSVRVVRHAPCPVLTIPARE